MPFLQNSLIVSRNWKMGSSTARTRRSRTSWNPSRSALSISTAKPRSTEMLRRTRMLSPGWTRSLVMRWKRTIMWRSSSFWGSWDVGRCLLAGTSWDWPFMLDSTLPGNFPSGYSRDRLMVLSCEGLSFFRVFFFWVLQNVEEFLEKKMEASGRINSMIPILRW